MDGILLPGSRARPALYVSCMKPIHGILAFALVMSAVACSTAPDTRSGAPGPTSAGSGAVAAPATPATVSLPPGGSVHVATSGGGGVVPLTIHTGGLIVAMREGASCAGIGAQISPAAGALKVEGQTLVGDLRTGCGCPTGPHFTLLLDTNASSLRARLCNGPGTDTCEAVCTAAMKWDLKDVMASRGATTIDLPPP